MAFANTLIRAAVVMNIIPASLVIGMRMERLLRISGLVAEHLRVQMALPDATNAATETGAMNHLIIPEITVHIAWEVEVRRRLMNQLNKKVKDMMNKLKQENNGLLSPKEAASPAPSQALDEAAQEICGCMRNHDEICKLTKHHKGRHKFSPLDIEHPRADCEGCGDPECPCNTPEAQGHVFETHSVTDVNGAGVHTEYWQECVNCHETFGEHDFITPCSMPTSDSTGSGDHIAQAHEMVEGQQSEAAKRKAYTKNGYWICCCGVVAMPLTDDTKCDCGDLYEQEWRFVEVAPHPQPSPEPTLAVKLLADVMHLWVDGYISKAPNSAAPESVANDKFAEVQRLLATRSISVDYCGWAAQPSPVAGQSDEEYLAKAQKFLEEAKKLNDVPVAWMVAAAFKNEDRARRAEEKLTAAPSPQDMQTFDEWWKNKGQFWDSTVTGSTYEMRIARAAWNAAWAAKGGSR